MSPSGQEEMRDLLSGHAADSGETDGPFVQKIAGKMRHFRKLSLATIVMNLIFSYSRKPPKMLDLIIFFSSVLGKVCTLMVTLTLAKKVEGRN